MLENGFAFPKSTQSLVCFNPRSIYSLPVLPQFIPYVTVRTRRRRGCTSSARILHSLSAGRSARLVPTPFATRSQTALSAVSTARLFSTSFARTGIGTSPLPLAPLWVASSFTSAALRKQSAIRPVTTLLLSLHTSHPPSPKESSRVVHPHRPRPRTYPADFILKMIASSPFSGFPIGPKPNLLLRKITASSRRLQKTSLLGLRGPPLAFPPDPHLARFGFDPCRLNEAVVDKQESWWPEQAEGTSVVGMDQRHDGSSTNGGRKTNNPDQEEQRRCSPKFGGGDANRSLEQTVRRKRVRRKTGSIHGRCIDCLVKDGGVSRPCCLQLQKTRRVPFPGQRSRVRKLTKKSYVLTARYLPNITSLGLLSLLGLDWFKFCLWALGMCAFHAPWLVLFLGTLIFLNCNTGATTLLVGRYPLSGLLGALLGWMYPPDSTIWVEWLEDRDKYFADDCVHRVKLRQSTSSLTPPQLLLHRVRIDISLLYRHVGHSRDHTRCSVLGLDQASPDSSLVKSLLSEKFGSPSTLSKSASPYGMFLGPECIGRSAFRRFYLRRILLFSPSILWFHWHAQWCWCEFLMLAPARLSPSAVYACRVGVLSADLPSLVYLQIFHFSCISTGFWELHDLSDHLFVKFMYLLFLSLTLIMQLSQLSREFDYSHLSRRTSLLILCLCSCIVYNFLF